MLMMDLMTLLMILTFILRTKMLMITKQIVELGAIC